MVTFDISSWFYCHDVASATSFVKFPHVKDKLAQGLRHSSSFLMFAGQETDFLCCDEPCWSDDGNVFVSDIC